MAWWRVSPIEVKAHIITNVTEMLDDGGRDISIDYEGQMQVRHASPEVLRLYEPVIGDYWVEYQTVAMPWNKEEFEKRHTKVA